MSFLAELGLDQITDAGIDYSIANGTYPAMISDSKIMTPSGSDDQLWQITYKIDPDYETYGGRTVSEFFNLDPNLPAERKVWIKRRLASLEVPDDEQATMDPADIVGTSVLVTVKNRQVRDKTYTNVTKVTLDGDGGFEGKF